jgi:hypothetical protein
MPSKQLHSSYSSPSIVRMIKLLRIRWDAYVAQMEKMRNTYKILVGKRQGGETFDNLITGRKILAKVVRLTGC